MSRANPLWGAPRIHGELQKLGLEISQAAVSKYLGRRSKPPSQTWHTFLDNHLQTLVSVDFFVVPTVLFKVLFVFVVLAHERRHVLHINVTDTPTTPVDGASTRGRLPLGDRPAIRAARSRCGLRGRVLEPRPDHGDP